MNNSFALKASSAPLDTAGEPRTQGKSKGFQGSGFIYENFSGQYSCTVRCVVIFVCLIYIDRCSSGCSRRSTIDVVLYCIVCMVWHG